MEHTSSWRIQRAGHLSREEYPLSLHVYYRVGYGYGGQERLGIGVERVSIDLVPLRDLDDVAQVHHRHPIADVPYHRQIVGDEQVRQVELLLQLLQQVDDLGLNGHVQRRHRLVTHNKLGVDGQRAGHPDALPLPAADSWGNLSAIEVRNPTSDSNSATLSRYARWSLARPCTRSGSPTMLPAVMRGFKEL